MKDVKFYVQHIIERQSVDLVWKMFEENDEMSKYVTKRTGFPIIPSEQVCDLVWNYLTDD